MLFKDGYLLLLFEDGQRFYFEKVLLGENAVRKI